MKRVTLTLDENLLDEARQLLGAESNSAAVNTALAEVIRSSKVRTLPRFFGSNIWVGSLAEMRQDRKRTVGRKR